MNYIQKKSNCKTVNFKKNSNIYLASQKLFLFMPSKYQFNTNLILANDKITDKKQSADRNNQNNRLHLKHF